MKELARVLISIKHAWFDNNNFIMRLLLIYKAFMFICVVIPMFIVVAIVLSIIHFVNPLTMFGDLLESLY